jgi:hypothetical protein
MSNFTDHETVLAFSQHGTYVQKRQIQEIRKSLSLCRRLWAWEGIEADKKL